MKEQVTDTVLMIRPAAFGYNTDTEDDYTFQSPPRKGRESEVHSMALAEFDAMVEILRKNGIKVLVAQDSEEGFRPDAIFPNNWFSTHSDGSVITYPMYAESRRGERSEEVLDLLQQDFVIDQRYSFEQYEEKNQFLEGTGSMIIDRADKVVYACLSERTHIQLLDKFCLLRGYEKIAFDAVDLNGRPIYHTNVMMCIGSQMAIVGLETIVDVAQRKFVRQKLNQSGKTVIEISQEQVAQFAGNMLQLFSPKKDEHFLVMSEQARKSLTPTQIKRINDFATILAIPIPTIEDVGGGSVRCMMAEIFLPGKEE
jgi:hypothetical protein